MKRFFSVMICICLPVFIFLFSGTGVLAVSGAQISEIDRFVVVSYGLDVLAGKTDVRISEAVGNTVNITKRSFMAGMNLSDVESICVTSLPDAADGVLYFGAEMVSAGQMISGDQIDKMTFSPSSKLVGECASFKFRINDSAYETTCRIYLLEDANHCPTVGLASYASLNVRTHRNISTGGILAGQDPDGDEIEFEVVKYPKDGVLTMTDKVHGAYIYTPRSSYAGKDSFEYVVRDRYGNYSASAKVNIIVSTPSVSVIYRDMLDSEIHTHAIRMTEQNIMNGVQVGEFFYFKPEGEVSRAEFLVTAMNALGIKDIPDIASTGFTDDSDILPEMKGYVSLAYSMGYISGKEIDGEICFCPDEVISVSEAAVIISNMIGYATPEMTPVFSQEWQMPQWSERAVISLHSLGIMQVNGGELDTTVALTRGKMAELLSRAMIIIGE